MGGQLSIRCICCKGNDHFEEETEDKINVGEKIEKIMMILISKCQPYIEVGQKQPLYQLDKY